MLTNCTRWPADPAFCGLFDELQPEALLAALLPQAGVRAADWSSCQILEALYDPGRQLRLAFALGGAKLTAARAWPDGQVFYLRYPVRRPMSRRGQVIQLGRHACELYRFPNDRRLRGLRRFAGRLQAGRVWQEWLEESGETVRLDPGALRRSLLRYVPEQKWIIRLLAEAAGGAGEESRKLAVVVRAGDPRLGPAMLARLQALRRAGGADGAFRIPKPVAFDERLGLLAVRWVWGEDLLELLKAHAQTGVLDLVARGLRCLHDVHIDGLTVAAPEDFLACAGRCAADIVAVCPEQSAALQELVAELGLRQPDAPQEWATVHNDFHWQQIRGRADRLTLLDFERCVLADPLADVATFAAQLDMLAQRSNLGVSAEHAQRWRTGFMRSWEEMALSPLDVDKFNWYAACALLVLARGQLRHLRPDWSLIVESAVGRARTMLAGSTMYA